MIEISDGICGGVMFVLVNLFRWLSSWGRVLLCVIAFAILLGACVAWAITHFDWSDSLPEFAAFWVYSYYSFVKANILLTVTLLTIFVTNAETVYQLLLRRRFKRVFGHQIRTQRYIVSIPEFKISDEANTALNAAGLYTTRKRFTPQNVPDRYKAGDIRRIIASSDLEGASFLLDEIGKYTISGPVIKAGDELFNAGDSFLAFGLQTNPNTQFLISSLNQFRKAQVELSNLPIRNPETSVRALAALTDFKSISMREVDEGESANLLVTTKSTDPIDISQQDSKRWNIGVVVIRCVGQNSGVDGRQILCAGVGHGGTSGSAYWLSQHWDKLHDKIGKKGVKAVMVFTATPMEADEGEGEHPEHLRAVVTETIELSRVIFKE